jgi:hypothetical protein|tara:strand:+ start:1694 stop:2284 length:591 start_codon:yes stop_codon:yes gene_type:complete
MAGLLSPMRIFNGFVIYKFLKYLTTDFEKMPAYKLGIIDNKGKFLKKQKDLETSEEKLASNIFFRLVINLRKILMKVPVVGSKLGRVASALFLVKEEMSKADTSGQAGRLIEQMFISFCDDNDIPIKENLLNEKFTHTQEPVVGDIIEDHEGNKIKITEEPVVVDTIMGLNIYECVSNNERIIFNKLQVEEYGMRL